VSDGITVNSISLAEKSTVIQGGSSPMADMTTYEMLDDVNLTVEAAHITTATHAIAGYVNGKYANWPAIVAKYGRSGKYLLSIDVQANPAAGAQCLDVEKGDATIPQAPGWVKVTRASGVAAKDLRFYPKVYVQESNAKALVDAMASAGIKRDTWLLWTAHYTDKAHICGPSTCGCPVQADATQYTSTFDGASLDASLCYGYFFAGPTDSIPSVPEAPATRLGTVAVGDMHAYASYRGAALDWAAVPGATSYDVQLLEGTTQVGRTTVKSPKVAFPVHPGTAYTWRVSALPGGEWSKDASFKSSPPPAPATPEAPVTPVEAPVTPAGSSTGDSPVTVPQPAPEPAEAPTGAKGVLVYVQEILEADIAKMLGLPVGTILFIPHTVEGA
jgi:hypothetical protein